MANEYTAEETLYLTKEGGVTRDKRAGVSKLVARGLSIPQERAQELGLLDSEGNAVEGAVTGEAVGGTKQPLRRVRRYAQPAASDEAGTAEAADTANADAAEPKQTTKRAAKKSNK